MTSIVSSVGAGRNEVSRSRLPESFCMVIMVTILDEIIGDHLLSPDQPASYMAAATLEHIVTKLSDRPLTTRSSGDDRQIIFETNDRAIQ